jgi:hypothetical protein
MTHTAENDAPRMPDAEEEHVCCSCVGAGHGCCAPGHDAWFDGDDDDELAQAWDEGYGQGRDDEGDSLPIRPNPYRPTPPEVK